MRVSRPREQQCGFGCGRDAEAIRITEGMGAAGEARDETGQAAEQAQACADIGNDRIGRRETRHRREREGPGRKLCESARFGVDVAVAQHELRRKRERAGHELVVVDAGGARSAVWPRPRADSGRRCRPRKAA
jgi:hypothetical protein